MTAVGSPVGLFLLLRGCRLRAPGSEPVSSHTSAPVVNNLYNIYHPFDPVAHRLEPLIRPGLASWKPAQIPFTKGGLAVGGNPSCFHDLIFIKYSNEYRKLSLGSMDWVQILWKEEEACSS
jgi:DDHD domain